MAKKRTIHVVGTGTLGEPLVNLLLDMKEDVAIDEITFHTQNRHLAAIML